MVASTKAPPTAREAADVVTDAQAVTNVFREFAKHKPAKYQEPTVSKGHQHGTHVKNVGGIQHDVAALANMPPQAVSATSAGPKKRKHHVMGTVSAVPITGRTKAGHEGIYALTGVASNPADPYRGYLCSPSSGQYTTHQHMRDLGITHTTFTKAAPQAAGCVLHTETSLGLDSRQTTLKCKHKN